MHVFWIACRRWLFCALALWLFAFAEVASAGKLVLKIQAANKSESQQPVSIRSSLPSRVTTNDIIDLGGLNLGYDVKSDTYYVFDTVELAPRQTLVREVQISDIWQISEEDLDRYQARSKTLNSALSGTSRSAEATEHAAVVEKLREEILTRQEENKITIVSPIRHIQAYEQSLKTLQELKQSVGRLENLAMAEGVNPGDDLIGEDRSAAVPRRDIHFPQEFGEAVVKISVHNSSAARPRRIDLRRDMPTEITVDDVIDSGGLDVRYDPKEHVTFVYKDDLEIPPSETITFEVRIRDKWNINRERMLFLQNKIDALQVMTQGRNKIGAVETTLNEANTALEEIRKEEGPETLSPAYIAFYRRQADRLDEVEWSLNRVDAALKPLETKRGFDMPAPDKKTTWLIIYAILGFLAIVSLLFFLRWFVRSS